MKSSKKNKKTKDYKEKALQVIEMLAMYESDQFGTDNEKLATPYAKFCSKIYTLAHAAVDRNCEHKNWEKELDDLYTNMRESKIL